MLQPRSGLGNGGKKKNILTGQRGLSFRPSLPGATAFSLRGCATVSRGVVAGTGENLLVTMALRWGLSPPERRQARGPFLRELLTPSSVPQLLPGPRRSPVSSTPTALHVWLERAAVHPLKPGIKCPLPCQMFASCLSLSPLNALSTASLLMLTILNLKIDFLSHLYHLVA